MKLKQGFVVHHEPDGNCVLVPVGRSSFSGIVRCNKSAGLVLDCLKTETDREGLLQALLAEYEADPAVVSADIDRVLTQLRGIGALDE
ncbi:MAG: PqqD family protein [Lachnospiraceae bacterium]|nr:PqqD family protein [Lachnospiraceae bacterium]